MFIYLHKSPINVSDISPEGTINMIENPGQIIWPRKGDVTETPRQLHTEDTAGVMFCGLFNDDVSIYTIYRRTIG
jgi:hypothetical protein